MEKDAQELETEVDVVPSANGPVVITFQRFPVLSVKFVVNFFILRLNLFDTSHVSCSETHALEIATNLLLLFVLLWITTDTGFITLTL